MTGAEVAATPWWGTGTETGVESDLGEQPVARARATAAKAESWK
jgi:hypothetical protein